MEARLRRQQRPVPPDWSVVNDRSGAARAPIVAEVRPRDLATLDDVELVRLAREDREAFGVLYDRYVERIYRFCYHRLGTREAAEDATSQTFIRALAGLKTHRDGTAFSSWLFTIAERVMIDGWRRQKPHLPLDIVPDRADTAPSPEDEALARERSDWLRGLLAQLPPDQRRAIELRLADLKGPEVAQVMGRPPGAVKMLQFRAMTTLRRLMGVSVGEGENDRDQS